MPGMGKPSSERREFWERTYMDRRQEIVSALVEFERLLSSSDTGVDSRLLDIVIARIPDGPKAKNSIREAVRGVANEYRALMRTAQREERVLVDHADRKFRDHSPRALGYMVFVARTGRNPVGTVELVRKEAYFILTCPNPADYNVFYNPSLETLPAAEFSKKVETLLGHGGTFHTLLTLERKHRTEQYDLPEITSGTIVAKMPREDVSFDTVLDHERQHFINHRLLRVFDASEGPLIAGKDQPRIQIARLLKDEIIAYVRDGRSGDDTMGHLLGDIYAGLFRSLTADEGASFRQTIATFAAALDQFPHASEPAYRRALIAHLVDVRLEKIPHRIEMAAEYYGGLIRRVESLGLSSDDIPEKATTSPRFASDRQRLRQSQRLYLELRKRCMDELYVLSPKAFAIMTEDLRIRRAAVERDMVALRPGGVAVPSGTVHYVDAKRTPEPTKPAMERASKEAFEDILARLTELSPTERTTFVHSARSGSEEAFSQALARGFEDSIVMPLLKRGGENVEIHRIQNQAADDANSVVLRVEANFSKLDEIYKTVYRIRIHGRPDHTSPVFRS